MGERRFVVELIKPSHYDNDGYVIQWARSWIPSNSLAASTRSRRTRGRRSSARMSRSRSTPMTRCHTAIPVERIVRRSQAGHGGLVCLVGVQSNQFPRAVDIARAVPRSRRPRRHRRVSRLRLHLDAAGTAARHRSGERPGHRAVCRRGRGGVRQLLADALAGTLQPIYNFMNELPDLQEQVDAVSANRDRAALQRNAVRVRRRARLPVPMHLLHDHQRSGRKSRWRDADDIERIVRANIAQGVYRFFITDDNFARNRNWEPIFDRMIEMREKEGLSTALPDPGRHAVPPDSEFHRKGGARRLQPGLHRIRKHQSREPASHQEKAESGHRVSQDVPRIRSKVITYAGYILGFPNDTPERFSATSRPSRTSCRSTCSNSSS